LIVYSLLGFVLLLFGRCRERTLLVWAGICLTATVMLYGAIYGLVLLGSLWPPSAGEIERAFANWGTDYYWRAEQCRRAFADGTFSEIFRQRLTNLLFLYQFSLFYLPIILAMFLIGQAAARRGVLREVGSHRALWRRVVLWGALIGLSGNLLFFLSAEVQIEMSNAYWIVLAAVGMSFGAPALSLVYVAGLTLLFESGRWRDRLSVLAPVGRMALTNYLAQSLICTTIFYSYGLGLFGTMGPAAGLLLTLVIFLAQIFWSRWWLGRFRFGPVEWIWRRLTYGRIPAGG
jgi:uncharacterized protein